MKKPKPPKLYAWKQEQKDNPYWTYHAPGMFCMLRQDLPSKTWDWVVYDGGGNTLAKEYGILSRQNAQRQAVAYITNREKENAAL